MIGKPAGPQEVREGVEEGGVHGANAHGSADPHARAEVLPEAHQGCRGKRKKDRKNVRCFVVLRASRHALVVCVCVCNRSLEVQLLISPLSHGTKQPQDSVTYTGFWFSSCVVLCNACAGCLLSLEVCVGSCMSFLRFRPLRYSRFFLLWRDTMLQQLVHVTATQ